MKQKEIKNLGVVMTKADIKSTMIPFLVLPEYKIQYSDVITSILGDLYSEYNHAFTSLIEANREFPTDYQYCISLDGMPINYFVQVDMVGLPDQFIEESVNMDADAVSDILRKRIFEIENSLAMYPLIEGMFSANGNDSFYKQQFRKSIDQLKKKFNKPIALLAVTEEKYKHMLGTEFGKLEGEILTPEEVQAITGFDAFFGPDEFKKHLEVNGGNTQFLLYVRSSEPVDKLRNPKIEVEHPLLTNRETRRIIKANTITLNIDTPGLSFDTRINDTKEYLEKIGMAYNINSVFDLFSPNFVNHLSQERPYKDYSDGDRLSKEFVKYLESQELDTQMVERGEIELRTKPMKASYGGYGHVVGLLSDKEFRQKLKRNIRDRGIYVVQPEMTIPIIENNATSDTYKYIDRNFFSFVNGQPQFLGGVRVLMPIGSTESEAKRIHGHVKAVYAEIN